MSVELGGDVGHKELESVSPPEECGLAPDVAEMKMRDP